MPRYNLDASVVIAWLFEQNIPAVDEFFAGLTAADDLSSAALLYPECISNIREAVFLREVNTLTASGMIETLLGLEIEVVSSTELSARAYELATRFQHKKAYDAHYLAAAELQDAELITRDRGLSHAAEAIGVPSRYLA